MSSNIEDIEKKLSEQVDALTLSNKNLSEKLVTITQAQSVCTEAKTSSANSSSEAKGYRDQASEIAGLNDVAGAMGLLSKVYGTHDLDIPFNDGIELTHGYGPLTFSRLSEATDINKSGQIQTFATDTPAITSKGCALFGELTTLNNNSDPKDNFGSSPDSITQTTDPDGGNDAVTFTVNTSTNRFQFSPSGLSIGDIVTVKWFEREDATGAPDQSTLSFGSLIDCNAKSLPTKIETVGDYSIFYAQVEITGVSPIIRLYFGDSIGIGNSGYSFYNFWLIKGDIPDAPIITANGSFTTRKPDIPTLPQIGNLPRPGDPFYIVVDVDKTAPDITSVIVANIYTNPSYVGVKNDNEILFYKGSGAGNSASFARSKVKARYVFSFSASGVSCYEDGVKLGDDALDMITGKSLGSTLNIGHYSSGSNSLNGYQKTFKIKHGVMTDDLAKAYGKWGE